MGQFVCKLMRKERKVFLYGLGGAGKTTLLYRLKLGETISTIPTIGFNFEKFEYNNVNLVAWDVGGREKLRPLMRHYFPHTDALVFVVDSNYRDFVDEVGDELGRLGEEDELRNCLFLILANKQDLEGAMTLQELWEVTKCDEVAKKRRLQIYGCSALTGEGLTEAMDFLCQELLSGNTDHRKYTLPWQQETKPSSVKEQWSVTSYLKGTLGYLSSAWRT